MSEDLNEKVTKMEKNLEETNKKLDAILERLTNQESVQGSDQG